MIDPILKASFKLPAVIIYNKSRNCTCKKPENETISIIKKAKRDLSDNLFSAIAAFVEFCYSKVNLAVKLLNAKYLRRLNNSDFAKALDILTNKTKATVWLAIGKYNIRS